jgi:hypothetical protein
MELAGMKYNVQISWFKSTALIDRRLMTRKVVDKVNKYFYGFGEYKEEAG